MSATQNAVLGGMAYRQAVEDAGNFIDQKFAESGWMMPDGAGGYSTTASGDAFDPDRVMTFDDKGMPSFVNAPSSLGLGQYGTTGMFARTAQEAAGQEAEARLATRVSGIRGGLARQREVMAETLGAQRMGEVSSDLMSSILGAYSGVTSDYRTELDKAIAAESEGAGAMAKTTPVTIPVTTPITTPVQETPTAPTTTQQPWWTQLKPGEDGGNQTVPSASRGAYDTIGDPGPKAPKTKTAGAAYKGPGGVLWVYRTNGPKGQGWYKKSKGGD